MKIQLVFLSNIPDKKIEGNSSELATCCSSAIGRLLPPGATPAGAPKHRRQDTEEGRQGRPRRGFRPRRALLVEPQRVEPSGAGLPQRAPDARAHRKEGT